MTWTEILISPPGLTLLATAAAYGLVAISHWLQNSYHLDAGRWMGLIADGYNFAEKEGLLHSLDGSGKLSAALARFEAQFAKVYAGEPTTQDIADATLEFAKLAFQSKFAPVAPAATAVTAAVTTTTH